MPELLEVEAYRDLVQEAVGATVVSVEADNLVCGETFGPCLILGQQIRSVRRKGKLLLLDFDDHVIGLHARMTGTVLLDGRSAFEKLRYAPSTTDSRFILLTVHLDDGRVLALHDPRRLARVLVDPDEQALGPDATSVNAGIVRTAVEQGSKSCVALKARLLDQSRISGLGNLLVDEICFQARLDPAMTAAMLTSQDCAMLARQIKRTLRELRKRGGSDGGALQEFRQPGAHCPRCGAPLLRRTVGGRTTYSCSVEQR